MDSNKDTPKHQNKAQALNDLSLGISIVVAVLLGIAIGYGLKKITGLSWTFWLGVFWGVGGAILNIYKAARNAKKELDEIDN